jgi:sugar phosphate isomerase/epimerase
MSTINSGLVGAEYFQKYPDRFISMHVQDVDMNPPLRDGRRPQVAVGKGSIDWVKTFRAAKTGGIKNYFVEQNWDLTQQSVAYLKALII